MPNLIDMLPPPTQMVGELQVVNTPSDLVEKILDGFPKEIWSDKSLKWLNPVSKNGVFELSLFVRLNKGLFEVIPNFEERRRWIIEEMIYSFAPKSSCAMIIRRNFLGKVWNSIREWSNLPGNVYVQDFLKVKPNSKGEIVLKDSNGKEKCVKFDCVVGNPPYQEISSDRKGSNASAIYPAFVEKAMGLNPRYLSMVIPGKWMTGNGQGTAKFLRMMLSNKGLSSIVATENSLEWFPGSDIDLKGGAMYFLIDSSKENSYITINGINQDISGMEVIIVDPVNIALVKKVLDVNSKTFDELVSGLNAYNIATNHKEWSDDKNSSYVCHYNDGGKTKGATRLIDKKLITKNIDTIRQWKVCTSVANGKGKDGLAYTFVAGPEYIVTHTYVLLAIFDTEAEANNASLYLMSKFAHYLISILKGSIHVSKKVFKFLPVLDFTRSYTDQDLYTMFDLSKEEIEHIENTTKDFPIFKVKSNSNKTVVI